MGTRELLERVDDNLRNNDDSFFLPTNDALDDINHN